MIKNHLLPDIENYFFMNPPPPLEHDIFDEQPFTENKECMLWWIFQDASNFVQSNITGFNTSLMGCNQRKVKTLYLDSMYTHWQPITLEIFAL